MSCLVCCYASILPLPHTHFLKAPDFCCLGVVLILQSFQIRRAIMLNLERPLRLERSLFPCYYYSDVACKLEHTKVRMRKGLAQDLHHFRDGITVTALDPEADGQGNGPGTVATFLSTEPLDSPCSRVQGNPWDSVITGNLRSFDDCNQSMQCFIFHVCFFRKDGRDGGSPALVAGIVADILIDKAPVGNDHLFTGDQVQRRRTGTDVGHVTSRGADRDLVANLKRTISQNKDARDQVFDQIAQGKREHTGDNGDGEGNLHIPDREDDEEGGDQDQYIAGTPNQGAQADRDVLLFQPPVQGYFDLACNDKPEHAEHTGEGHIPQDVDQALQGRRFIPWRSESQHRREQIDIPRDDGSSHAHSQEE